MTYDEYTAQLQQAIDEETRDDSCFIADVLGAALVCALLVGTEEGERRGIAITSEPEKRAWKELGRYTDEVKHFAALLEQNGVKKIKDLKE